MGSERVAKVVVDREVVSEASGYTPAAVGVMEDDGDHGGKRARAVSDHALPEADHVAKHAQRHPRILRGLMLEEDVDVQRVARGRACVEQEIRAALSQRVVDESDDVFGAGRQAERPDVT